MDYIENGWGYITATSKLLNPEKTLQVTCKCKAEPTWDCGKYSCAKEEQCDDCWLIDHKKVCAYCEHYDHD